MRAEKNSNKDFGDISVQNNSDMIYFTPDKYRALRGAYDKAVANNLDQFRFEGQLFLTHYAKYVLEYLETKFRGEI